AKDVSVKVLDVNGKTVREFRQPPATVGFHRLQWSPPKAGGYRVVLNVDGKELPQMLVAENDPNADARAVITDGPLPVPGRDDDGDLDVKEVVPFIPKAED